MTNPKKDITAYRYTFNFESYIASKHNPVNQFLETLNGRFKARNPDDPRFIVVTQALNTMVYFEDRIPNLAGLICRVDRYISPTGAVIFGAVFRVPGFRGLAEVEFYPCMPYSEFAAIAATHAEYLLTQMDIGGVRRFINPLNLDDLTKKEPMGYFPTNKMLIESVAGVFLGKETPSNEFHIRHSDSLADHPSQATSREVSIQ